MRKKIIFNKIVKKKETSTCCLQETLFPFKDKQTWGERMGKDIHAEMKTGVLILLPHKIDF